MRNISKLQTREFENIKVSTETSDDIEETIIKEHLQQIKVENLDKEIIVQTNLSLGKIDYGYIETLMPPSDSITADTLLVNNAEVAEKVGTEIPDSVQTEPLLPNFKELGIPHFLETSSKTGENNKNVFEMLTEAMLKKRELI